MATLRHLPFANWAYRDAIIAKLDTEIARFGDDATAMSSEAQAARISELRATLVHAQRQEEAIIEQLEAEGVQIRRLVSDPAILLGIELVRQ